VALTVYLLIAPQPASLPDAAVWLRGKMLLGAKHEPGRGHPAATSAPIALVPLTLSYTVTQWIKTKWFD
jgi:hypothetical protein